MRPSTLLVLLVPLSSIAGQSTEARPPLDDSLRQAVESMRIPIHTAPTDPDGGAYGTWGGAFDYKVEFGDGITFHPRRGSRPARPFGWQTESLRVGEHEMLGARPVTRSSDFRYEIDYGGVVEAYDIRREGLEQSWIIASRPVHSGDIVVTGQVTTELDCADMSGAHQRLRFAEDETDVIDYGSAFAFDARGRRVRIDTELDGSRIRLRVPHRFVESASFPLTIDPLIARLDFRADGPTYKDQTIVVGRDTTTRRVIVGYTVQFSFGDDDGYVVATNRSFQNPTLRFSDMTTSWSTNRVAAAYSGGVDDWILGLEREFTSGVTAVRCYVHSMTNFVANGGTTMFLAHPASSDHFLSTVGGAWLAHKALLTVTETPVGGGRSVLKGVRVLPNSATFGAQFEFSEQLFETLSEPSVMPLARAQDGWVVALSSNSFGQHVKVARVPFAESAASASSTTLVTVPAGRRVNRPVVAGAEGRYLAVYYEERTQGVTAEDVHSVRFDWQPGIRQPTVMADRFLGSHAGGLFDTFVPWEAPDVGYDLATRSHWLVAWPGGLRRLGHTGGEVEIPATLPPPPPVPVQIPGPLAGPVRLAYSEFGGDSEFLAVAREGFNAARVIYDPEATTTEYGSSCAPPSVDVVHVRPEAGHEFFGSTLTGVAPGTSSFLFLGFAPATGLDLGAIGLPGCELAIGSSILTFPATANSIGRASVTFALADDPVFRGDLYTQWFYVDPSVAPLPLRALHGTEHLVR